MEDTERRATGICREIACFSCSGFDPMEDTESLEPQRSVRQPLPVAVGSIRWRILKGAGAAASAGCPVGCSGFDPMEDTERLVIRHEDLRLPPVAVGSIRWRILKG